MQFTEILDALKKDTFIYAFSPDVEGVLKIKLGERDDAVLRDIIVIRSDGKEIVYNYREVMMFDRKCNNAVHKALDDAVNLRTTIQECILRILEAFAEYMHMGVFMRMRSNNFDVVRKDEMWVKEV